jgi:hypothetical protein
VLGIRCHSGWAAVILVSASGDSIEVVDRRRIALCDPSISGSKQPPWTQDQKLAILAAWIAIG